MSWQEHIKHLSYPESASQVRRVQFLRLGCIVLFSLILIYGVIWFLFKKPPLEKKSAERAPTLIETPLTKRGTDEEWRCKMEEDNKKLYAEVTSLKTLFEEGVKDKGKLQTASQDLEDKIHELENRFEERFKDFQGGSSSESSIMDPNSFSAHQENSNHEDQPIQKFTLALTESPQQKQPHLMRIKTVDTTIPAGAFAKTVLLSGLDASSAMNASSDPRPMLLRLIDPGTLPRKFQSDLKDCHCLASAYGDLSSERVYARLEKLTCIERATGEIIETQVAGYIAGSDGKAGIRGVVASKDGQFLGRSLVGGIFAGLSNVANPQNRQGFINPFTPGNTTPPSIGETFTSGMAGGAATALDRLSQYYIDRAEQLQPVIQVAAGQVVDIVFTEGTFIGSQDVHADIRKQRSENRIKGEQNEPIQEQ
ncbi:MAG: hypothetical protein BGO67_09805 [Alphaproteobacteria bacterium 41-28]|nr:MAG: hypothetical protein BGO67_09805 [Alphaproteobacteria bacterium 41-28]